MRVEFQDFYKQHITIHNETCSGNVRIAVNTCENLNDTARTKREDCTIETDISLDYAQLKFLLSVLRLAEKEAEAEY